MPAPVFRARRGDLFLRGYLHSFAYAVAESGFRSVAERDPRCAMAHWDIAMTYFRQLWEPPLTPATSSLGEKESQAALQIGGGSEREREFVHAIRFKTRARFRTKLPSAERTTY